MIVPHQRVAPLLLALASLLAAGPVRGGALADFEAGAVSGTGGSGGDVCLDDPILFDFMARLCTEGIFYGGACSWFRNIPDANTYMDLPVEPRLLGEGLIPFARADTAYHWIESDVDAVDYSVEAGFGPFAGRFSQVLFEEDSPDDDLTLTRWHGLLRLSFGSGVEIDLGFGAQSTDGDNRTERFSFTSPILYHPLPGTGIEFRPAWSGNVEEYDVALLGGWKFASLKAGYRWLHSPGQSLNGPYAGLSVHF